MAVARHLGRTRVTSTPGQRQEALAGTPEIQPSGVLRYMGTDIYLEGTPTPPRNLTEVRAAPWKQLRPQQLSPDAAMMVLMAKLPSKLRPLASVYRPTANVHTAKDALMVRAYNHMTGIPRQAYTDTLLGPWEHGCQGVTRSAHSWQTAVVRESVRQGAWAKRKFRDSQTYSLQTHQALRGGCPAVLTPGQYTHHPKCPHLIAKLQRVVDEVALPMWMPGRCLGSTPILVRGPGGPRAGAAAAPAPKVEVYPTPYGDVIQVVIPGLPSPGGPLHRGLPRATGVCPEGAGAGPQGNPRAARVADPPHCHPGLVLPGCVSGGSWHTLSSGIQLAASMVSCMAAVTRRRCPLWHIVTMRLVLGARPPMTPSA